MQKTISRSLKKLSGKFGRKLLTSALDGFYYFDDDEIEDKIDQADIRFRSQGRKEIRKYIWSFPLIRDKICKIAFDMYYRGSDVID